MADTNKLVDSLNQQVANWTVLYTKLHNFHWFVKGPHFFTLHEKFEELYNEAAENLDELAERILQLEGKPLGTLKESLEKATIKEAKGNEDTNKMVQAIVNDFNTIIDESKDAISTAIESEDDTTADILLGIYKPLEKHVWMLNAFVSK
ncbi:Dps family protein [Lederbergia graminis]|uniref:Dps family protein n=1 Tax=Lederbergia graminis TaxID=735518 RepID=A0ABW0LLC0_9BACI|nr:Dps family protein [Paenibacillus bovis]HLU21589.1 Dps family protein [Bacillaceae bacterium]